MSLLSNPVISSTPEDKPAPKKYNTNFKHDEPNHKLQLEFINGKLKNWGPEKKSKKNKRK